MDAKDSKQNNDRERFFFPRLFFFIAGRDA